MSYLGRSGSAEGEGQTVLGGGGGVAGGALSFPFSGKRGWCCWRGRDETHWGSVWPVVGHYGVGEGKRPERLTEDGSQCHGWMPGGGRGLGVAGRGPG